MKLINHKNSSPIKFAGGKMTDIEANAFPIIYDIPRIADIENYTKKFVAQ